MVTAHVTSAGDAFVAKLSNGDKVIAASIDRLAFGLHDLGVRADTAHCGDWREPNYIGAGKSVALKAALRDLDAKKDIE